MANEKTNQKELLAFAQAVQDLYEYNQAKSRKIYFFNFLKGVAGGAGAFLGGVLMLFLLLWLLSSLGQVPFVGHLAQEIKQTVEHQSGRSA